MNEAAIVQALRQAGIGVYRLSDPGCPDLLCYRGWWSPESATGATVTLLEVKSQTGRLTKAQRGYMGPRYVVRTVAEALAVFRILPSCP